MAVAQAGRGEKAQKVRIASTCELKYKYLLIVLFTSCYLRRTSYMVEYTGDFRRCRPQPSLDTKSYDVTLGRLRNGVLRPWLPCISLLIVRLDEYVLEVFIVFFCVFCLSGVLVQIE